MSELFNVGATVLREYPSTEVTPDEVKAFMNEPEPEVKVPEPMGMDDWEPAEPVKDNKLTTEQIAKVGYSALGAYGYLQGQLPIWFPFDDEPDHMKQHYLSKVSYFIQTAANPNGYEECMKMHDLVLDAKLRTGWRFGDVYSEEDKTDPNLLPYSRLPMHERAKDFLFRNVVISLLQVWKGH